MTERQSLSAQQGGRAAKMRCAFNYYVELTLFRAPKDGRHRFETALDGQCDKSHRVAGVDFQKRVQPARVLKRVHPGRAVVAFFEETLANHAGDTLKRAHAIAGGRATYDVSRARARAVGM